MLGDLFLRRNQINRAVENFKRALELVKKVNPGQLDHAEMLNSLGEAVHRAGMLDESLQYFQEAKEILDNHIEVEYLTSKILNNIGTTYDSLGEFLLAFQCFKDAVDMTIISGKLDNVLCWNMANTMKRLSVTSISKTRGVSQSKGQSAVVVDEDVEIDESIETDVKMPITKEKCLGFLNTCYQLSLFSKELGKQDEMLKYLEEARVIAKVFDYKCGRVVLILLLLSMTYGEMRSFDKMRSYYEGAKEMAKTLPPEDDSILPGELSMIESMKKRVLEKPQYQTIVSYKFLTMLFN